MIIMVPPGNDLSYKPTSARTDLALGSVIRFNFFIQWYQESSSKKCISSLGCSVWILCHLGAMQGPCLI